MAEPSAATGCPPGCRPAPALALPAADDRVPRVFSKVKPDGHAQEVLNWIRANIKT